MAKKSKPKTPKSNRKKSPAKLSVEDRHQLVEEKLAKARGAPEFQSLKDSVDRVRATRIPPVKRPSKPRSPSGTQLKSAARTIDKLVISISYAQKPDGSHVGWRVLGDELGHVFVEGGQAWSNIKGSVLGIIDEMGPLGPGREVVLRSYP